MRKNDLPADPLQLFKTWMDEALSREVPEPNAMAVSTVGKDKKPSVRTVLLKELNSDGLVFYTNYNSRKSKEIEESPEVGILFFWPSLERQVRIEGTAQKTKKKESDEYFKGRPRNSQIAAWASPQSDVISSREALEERYNEFERKFVKKRISRPPYWGGYRIKPFFFEFWQGRPGRMNDRIIYRKEKRKWIKDRLAP